jgi:hypothetical protein
VDTLAGSAALLVMENVCTDVQCQFFFFAKGSVSGLCHFPKSWYDV